MIRGITPRLMAFLVLFLGAGVLFAHPALAQDFGNFARTAGFSTQDDVVVIIARLIRTAISLVGVVAVVFIIFGGFMWMTAGGNPDRLKKAKSILTNAIIGLLIVFSSFAIVQFVLGSLVEATDSTITQTNSAPYTFLDSSGGPSLFYLRSVNTDCASALQNLELQFVFSKNIKESTVKSGIVVSKVNGGKVKGTFEVSGKRVTFTPSSTCAAPNATLFCFDSLASYEIQISDAVLKSSTGSNLICNTTYPCRFTFTTGTGVDTHAPVVNMDTPDDGQSLYSGAIALLQAATRDDTGVSTTDFYVIDDDEAVFISGTDLSTAGKLVGGNAVNAFYTDTSEEWDTSGYMTNESYDIWARGFDCAGNSAAAAKVEIILRASSCNNDVMDTDLGEIGIDCGGEDTSSSYYCGMCEGGECEEDSDCAAGHCENGFCVVTPRIEEVSPGDGAVGNLITISGEGFGSVPGQVVFLGSSSTTDDKTTGAAVCNEATQWADSQIIVAVPQGAVDGPIMVRTGAAVSKTDSTNDDYGPSINFDVNAIVRPGICELDPVEGIASSSVSVHGNGFGASQGNSTFYFTDYEASSYIAWGNNLLSVAVPNVDSRLYRTQVFTGDFVCVSTDGLPTEVVCAEDSDCNTALHETCATSVCMSSDGLPIETLCVEDSDCNVTLKETCATAWCSETLDYCEEDRDCGSAGGDCVSIRVGSNKVRFDVRDTLVDTTPVISSIDTGWRACLAGDDAGERCAQNADCSPLPGSCEAAPNWGPPGQYVTIYGTNFGTRIGTVRLRNEALGYDALMSTDFPDACSEDFWHDTQITVIVPSQYINTKPIQNIAHALTVVRADGEVSEPTSFVVLNDVPGPAMCRINPSAGPVGTDVNVYGDHFGSATGTALFYDQEIASVGLWGVSEVRGVDVPVDAQTGPVSVIESVSGYSSNPLNFEVGDCRDDASLCQTGKSCCFNGTCSATCETFVPPVAHYAYRISTGITPLTPKVVVECTTTGVSPTPWEGWSLPEDICLNSQIEAEFDMAMKPATLNSTTILVHACTDYFTAAEETAGLGKAGQCQTWTAQTPTAIVTDATGFSWVPVAGVLSANTLYRVTIDGQDSATDTQAVTSVAGGLMTSDFTWQFTTRNSSANCEVGGVNVRPGAYSTSEQGVDIPYSAQLVAANDMCVALSCTGYDIGWDSDFDGAMLASSAPPRGVCANSVDPIFETPVNDPAIITATVTNAEGDPEGDGELVIDFTDPEVAEFFPSCTQACVNVMPWTRFNIAMNATTLTASSVELYKCQDSLCARSELPLAPVAASVAYDSVAKKASLVFSDNLVPNTWYRVVLDGALIKGANGNPLSDSGSNYGADENKYFAGDFSWKFKTRDSDISCSIDSVEILPSEVTLNVIGERQEYSASAYGAPDACSANGQTLQASSYQWSQWLATDTPNSVMPATGNANDQVGIVAYMIESGAISISGELPASCTSSCLNAGAPVTITQGVCGNNVLELSEECDDGGTEDGNGCSAICLNEGKSACSYKCEGSRASCTTDNGCEEICEEGRCSLSDGVCVLTSDCPFDSGDTCDISNAPCCGDSMRTWSLATGGEDCDDGNSVSGDGCSSSCKNEGSNYVDAVCGDGSLDWETGTGGEDCDDHNTTNGDGCSLSCLKEGSEAEENVYAICGNGGLPQEGEDCDGGNAMSGDGCSSACLNEGRNQCVYVCSISHTSCLTSANCLPGQTCGPLITPCCGNSAVESGEDCDGGLNGQEGCSARCLFEGASVDYSTPSFCGDGDDEGIGEECDALSSSEFVVGPYSVAQVATGAPREVNATTGYATSQISVMANGKSDTASLALQCVCSTDATCGNSMVYGCGENACCFARPTLEQAYPPYNIGASGGGYCRNTAIWVEFSQDMDEETFQGNLYLELMSINGNAVDSVSECPAGYSGAIAFNDSTTSPIAQLWDWAKSLAVFMFAQEAQAIAPEAMAPSVPFTGCYLPVSYYEVEQLGGHTRVHLLYSSLLVEGGIYELNVLADNTPTDTTKNGVLSANETVLCLQAGCTSNHFRQGFHVGSDICELDRVLVEDGGDVDAAEYESLSPEFFSATNEEHLFRATPQTLRSESAAYEEISPLLGSYEWAWSWTSSEPDTVAENVVSIATGDPGNDTSTNFVAAGNDGKEKVIATATITTNEIFEDAVVNRATTGLLEVTALVCENPWPSFHYGFPYTDSASNFSFYFCRDAGEDGTQDDLPALEKPIDVTSLSSADIMQELIFKVSGTSDAIGVRVIANDGTVGATAIASSGYLSPSAWVEAQGFTGSFSATQLDGYEAVESGTTLYAAATNQSGSSIYPNIYVVSYNENAGEAAGEIFARVLNSWRFNANDTVVTDVNLCAASGGYITKTSGEYLPCVWDGDCFETCQDKLCTVTGSACESNNDCSMGSAKAQCDARKAKLTRDMRRLTDVTDLVSTLRSYGQANGHCSVTKEQECESDSDCFGEEECVAGYPDMQSGTFVPALTNSAWDSWNAVFGNALGSAASADPINDFYSCGVSGYDPTSCWNGETGTFVCPDRSHVYGYQSVGGEDYKLFAQLETAGNGVWSYDIDTSLTDEATIVVEYPFGYAPSSGMPLKEGFETSAQFCNANPWGTSTLCGDGTRGPSEACEIGDTRSIDDCSFMTDLIVSYGRLFAACLSDCSGYQDEIAAEAAGAQCVPYTCGNGIVETFTGEVCDDGALNGTYNHCDDNCQLADAYYCGDGYLAGGEQCDCGITGLYNYSDSEADDSISWAFFNSCDASNGQWTQDITTSCSYDCRQPGPSCGDGLVNGGEGCDSEYEEWAGKLCTDGITTCVVDSDCDSGQTCGTTPATVAAGIGDVCTDYVDAGGACTSHSQCDSVRCINGACTSALDAGDVCTSDTDCSSGSCPDFNYSLFRYRTCSPTCGWNVWVGPVGGTQVCGNGVVEGNEVCDDGNSSNNDGCLNTCIENVCGDDFVYLGIESCDDGDDNGEACDAPYGGTCNYCNVQCQYKTTTGGYCGDGIVNGGEVCDGEYSMVLSYFDAPTNDKLPGSCLVYGSTTAQDSIGYTCRWLGVCNGGSEQGEFCTPNPDNPKLLATTGNDTDDCSGGGKCVAPACADNCGTSCPLSYETTGLLVQSELANAQPSESVSLYSYQNNEGNSPDNAALFVPACSVATQITADVSKGDAVLPDLDIVFVTDLSSSMNNALAMSSNPVAVGERRIDYAIEAAQTMTEELFDLYDGSGVELRIGSVSFSSLYRDDIVATTSALCISSSDCYGDGLCFHGSCVNHPALEFCNSTSSEIEIDGAYVDIGLTNNEALVRSELNSYASCVCQNCLNSPVGSGTGTTYKGIEVAVQMLDDSDADLKVVVLLTFGGVEKNKLFQVNGNGDDCDSSLNTYSNEYEDIVFKYDAACVSEIVEDLIDEEPDVLFFSGATVRSENIHVAYASHMSSNSCAWDDVSLVSDCSGGFGYVVDGSEAILNMTSAIVGTIAGTNVSFTVDSITTTGGVGVGNDVVLPFPGGFACEDVNQTIPMRASFTGGSTVQFSDLQLLYCPYE